MFKNNLNIYTRNLILLNELYEIEEMLEKRQQISIHKLNTEIKIIQSALEYERGKYSGNNYINPDDAYFLLLKNAYETNEISVKNLGNKIIQEIYNIDKCDTPDISYLNNFIQILISYFLKEKCEERNPIHGIF